ncbi:P1 family peptidase [Clostridium taeniosporum]|uniref:Peptidase S58 family protein n=1 Tax=Clostridium taeniosporum TaxID=394958 RepID=A0A1D7XHN6_9CLOT|nr:P1 family peptidase [Clostridium taeniosporum]AOR22847.1 peptidase S58 family protein [Clostridium taeniosporum]
MKEIKFCNINGIKLGHAQDKQGGTGCSVVICENGATGGVDVRGGAPGTRETDLLNPMEMVDKIHAVVLSGGSAFGLDASSGVMEYLENKNIGFDVTVAKVPIVCQAVLFDLSFGNPNVRPDKSMGIRACLNAEEYSYDINGNIGAGFGATVGKFLGPDYAMKGGLGTYAIKVGDLEVGAIVAVNCLGDVINPKNLNIISGAYDRNKNKFLNTENLLLSTLEKPINPFKGNTTIGLIVTNANFTKAEANKVASMAHNGYARTIYPSHTMFDGDTIFTMATNKISADVTTVGMIAAKVMEKAILRGVKSAESMFGVPSFKNIIR